MTDLRRIFALYDRAYRLLNDVTPRRFNCGTLCGAACCHNLSKSGDTETGMLLLPFEKDYLQHAGATGYSYLCDSNREEPDMLICSGLCDRRFRPFACRIFPCYASFFEVKNGKTALRVRPDPRAAQICPLVTNRAFRRSVPRFIRNVKKAVRVLSAEPEIYADLQKTSDFLNAMYDFYGKLVQ